MSEAPKVIWVSDIPWDLGRIDDLKALGFAWNISHGHNSAKYHHDDTVAALQAKVALYEAAIVGADDLERAVLTMRTRANGDYEADNGERAFMVHSDEMFLVEQNLTAYRIARQALKETTDD